jgi:hypothetical protein
MYSSLSLPRTYVGRRRGAGNCFSTPSATLTTPATPIRSWADAMFWLNSGSVNAPMSATDLLKALHTGVEPLHPAGGVADLLSLENKTYCKES